MEETRKKATREKGKRKKLNNHESQEGGVERVSRLDREKCLWSLGRERTILTPGGKRRRTRVSKKKFSLRLERPGGGRSP